MEWGLKYRKLFICNKSISNFEVFNVDGRVVSESSETEWATSLVLKENISYVFVLFYMISFGLTMWQDCNISLFYSALFRILLFCLTPHLSNNESFFFFFLRLSFFLSFFCLFSFPLLCTLSQASKQAQYSHKCWNPKPSFQCVFVRACVRACVRVCAWVHK